MCSTAVLKWQRKESVCLKIDQKKLTHLKKRGKKTEEYWVEPQSPVGQYQVVQFICNCSPRKGGEKRAKNNIWRNNSPKLLKFCGKHYTFKKFSVSKHKEKVLTPGHTVVKLLKLPMKILKAGGEKWRITQTGSASDTTDFSSGTMEAGRHWNSTQILKGKLPTRNSISTETTFSKMRAIPSTAWRKKRC